VVVVAAHGDGAWIVDGGADHLALLEVVGDEDVAGEAGTRRVRRDRVGEVAGGGARHGLEAELDRLRDGDRDDPVLVGEGRVVDGVVLDPELPHAEHGGEPSRSSWGVAPFGGAGDARRAARIRSDRNGAPAPRLRVEGEERVRVGGGLAGEQADRLGGLQRARERGDRPEHAGLLARRHVARRRRLLEDAAVARAPPGEHGEELRAEAEHAGVPSPAAASAVAAGAPRPPTPITRTRPRAIFSSIVDMGNKKAPLQSGRGAHQRANPYLSPPAKAASELAPASLSGPVAVASPGLALSHSG